MRGGAGSAAACNEDGAAEGGGADGTGGSRSSRANLGEGEAEEDGGSGGSSGASPGRPPAPSCLVALWVTNRERHRRFIEAKLLPAWGLRQVTTWYWLKVTAGGQPVGRLVSARGAGAAGCGRPVGRPLGGAGAPGAQPTSPSEGIVATSCQSLPAQAIPGCEP